MTKKKLRNSALVFSLILMIWPVFVATSIPEGSMDDQIMAIQNAPLLHILNFLIAMSIAPAMLIMLKRMYPYLEINPGRNHLSMVIFFYTIYLLLITLSYGSQVFYLPFIIENYPDPGVENWFFYHNDSLAITFNQTGYLSWSIATLLYVIPSLKKVKGALLFAVLLFMLSAIIQITASIGLYARIPGLAALTFYSGLLMFPAGILVLIFAIKSKK